MKIPPQSTPHVGHSEWNRRGFKVSLIGFFCIVLTLHSFAADPSSSDFFEKKIRPLLSEHCYECHGEKKQKGGLRLDSREGWVRGGDSGTALIPYDAAKSRVVQAVRHGDPDFQMPPEYKLSTQQIADLERWVNSGAPDPRSRNVSPLSVKNSDIEKGRKHWAYQTPRRVSPPKVKNISWPANEMDRFILARLESKGIKPGNDASKASLIRRAYFDLVGLPPSPEEILEFENDHRPQAFNELLTRLLGSPRFGERWARHWLDVARFGESVTLRGFVFKEAWRYRDYVIQAFNQDLPYDQFVQEQIAGDLLAGQCSIAEKQRMSIATTFLMLGNSNLEEQDKKQLDMDVVDEQLDTLGKAFLGQTIGCARCHDHKFDPIPTSDYYAMAGILRGSQTLEHSNVSQWVELPLSLPSIEEEIYKSYELKSAALQAEITALKGRLTNAGIRIVNSLLKPIRVSDLPGVVMDEVHAKRVGDWVHSTFSNNFVGEGFLHDGNAGKGTKTLTFFADALPGGRYEVRLAYVANPNRTERLPVMILHAGGETIVHVNQQKVPPIDGRFVSLGEFQFEANGQGYVLISNEGTQGYVIADAVQFLSMETKPNPEIPKTTPIASESVHTAEIEALKQLEARLKQMTKDAPQRPMVMGLKERADAADLRIHIRGSVHNLGEIAPRGFLRVAYQGNSLQIPAKESGRKELAQWVGSRANPLIARVMVNRVFGWLFGAGLVRTVDNLGTTGENPSHPELLDFLAIRFMEEGWSVKKLVRELMTSRTYQLAVAELQPQDPANRLLSRANLRRLEAECLRDAILSISGQLQFGNGGPTIKQGTTSDYSYIHTNDSRSVYLPVLRNSLPELLEVFDFPDPSMVVGTRNVSSVAQQSLFLINHPWMHEQSRHAAKRWSQPVNASPADCIDRAYRLAIGRAPTTAEKEVSLNFLNQHTTGEPAGSSGLEAWADLWQAIFTSVDFRYLN